MTYPRAVDTTEHRVRIGDCPACTWPLWADATTVTTIGSTIIDPATGKPSVHASAKVVACHINHDCDKRTQEDA